MVIDAHVHLKHGDVAATEYTPEQVVDMMDQAGICRSVVFAMSTTTARSIEMAEAAATAFPDRLIPFVYALPSYTTPVLDLMEDALSNRGFRGIKIHIGECSLRPYIVDPVFELAGSHGVPCLVDFGGDLRDSTRLSESFPDTPLIIAHMGRYLCTDVRLLDQFISLAGKHEQTYLDLAGVVMNWKIEDAARRLGSERLLFGTDGPYPTPDPVSRATGEIDRVRMLRLSDDDKANILGLNAARLFGLTVGSV